MRVVLVGTGVQPIPPEGYGGVERTLSEYARALRAAGHEVTVVNEVRGRRNRDEYRFALRLPRLLEGMEYDVLHASSPVVANRLAWMGRPFTYTSHSRHWFEIGGWRGRWGLWLERRAVRRAVHTVALTERLRSRMIELVGPSAAARTSVIPIGVDTDRFRPDWNARRGNVALGVGVVAPFKRWHLAAAALKGTGVRLRLLGPTPDTAYAAEVRAAGDDVEIVGEVSDEVLRTAYSQSDLLVHPSRVELLAGVVLQGLSAGLPVLGASPVADLVDPGAGRTTPAEAS
ncbi:MAG TPA: glycosyltransferase family 4 protein, partial [Thermoplasmata archaeon]